jgi:hypothetical protein
MVPVSGSSVGTGAPPIDVAGTMGPIVELPVVPTVAGTPLIVSLVSTLPAFGLPVAPFIPVTTSGVATTGAVPTGTVIVAS